MTKRKRLMLSGAVLIATTIGYLLISVFSSVDLMRTLAAIFLYSTAEIAAISLIAHYCFVSESQRTHKSYTLGFGIYALLGFLHPVVEVLYYSVFYGATEINWILGQVLSLPYFLTYYIPSMLQTVFCFVLIRIKFEWTNKLNIVGWVSFALSLVFALISRNIVGILYLLAFCNIWLLERGDVWQGESLKSILRGSAIEHKMPYPAEHTVIETELSMLKQQYETQIITEEEYNRKRKEILSRF